MGRLVSVFLLLLYLALLLGCPAKDWMKREDSYLSVEQYKTMTQVISINDSLYRVKKGEEINQNKITQLFINLQNYINTPEKEQKKHLQKLKKGYESRPTMFNTMSYVLALLETQDRSGEAHIILSQLDYSSMNIDDKNLHNLAQILHALLKSNKSLQSVNSQLNEQIDSSNKEIESVNKEIDSVNKKYKLVQEEMTYLNKQVNALKSIEENIHAREVGLELENK